MVDAVDAVDDRSFVVAIVLLLISIDSIIVGDAAVN
jgi:hypothetical protein